MSCLAPCRIFHRDIQVRVAAAHLRQTSPMSIPSRGSTPGSGKNRWRAAGSMGSALGLQTPSWPEGESRKTNTLLGLLIMSPGVRRAPVGGGRGAQGQTTVRLTPNIVQPFTTSGIFHDPWRYPRTNPSTSHSLPTHDPLGSGAKTKGVLLKKLGRVALLTFPSALRVRL